MTTARTLELSLGALVALSSIGCGDTGGLVGTWHHADALGYVESWELTRDGRVTYEWMNEFGSPRIVEGDYTVDGDTLHIEGAYVHQPGTSVVSEWTFYAGPDRASIPAFVPIGDHDGWVGTWTMRYHDRLVHDDGRPDTASGGEEVLELDADGSARWERTFDDGGAPEQRSGTWREVEGAIEVIQVEDGEEFLGLSFPTLDGAALARFPLERVD